MGMKIVLVVAFAAAFAVVINGRDMMSGGEVDKAFLHPYFPPYHGVFGGYRGGGGFGGNGGRMGGRDSSQDGGGIAGTGGIGGLESGATSDDAFGDDVETGAAAEVAGGSLP